uniref:Uncharacterized protein n=1 Tax=Tetradesmus obliquus TaxID=3088 RepID=A0A383WDF9_TETOB|eukprot:jgi/Sobl393_1/12575/SZX75202.1
MDRAAAAAAAAAATAAAGSQADDEEQPEAELEFIGCFKTVIVGIRYYTGRVGVNEMVKFVREPRNPYDANAVKVENTNGEQVGHLKRELVYEIASMLDADQLRIEGVMPGGSRSTFTMPVTIYCFVSSTDVGVALRRKVASLGLQFTAMSLQEAAAAAAAAGHGSGGRGGRGSSSGGRGGGAAAAGPQVYLAPAQLENSLNRLFEDLYSSAASRPRMDASDEVLSQLFPHQQEALAWMVNRENSNTLPPFWSAAAPTGRGAAAAAGGVVYTNTLTNFETSTRPEPLRGGILADDMGLGKTLMVIALIATNAPGAQLPPLVQVAGAAAAAEAPEEPEKGRPKKRQKKAPNTSASQLQAAAKRKSDADAAAAAAAAGAAGSSPPAADGPRGTLIVCPLSVLSNWQMQLEEHTAGNLKLPPLVQVAGAAAAAEAPEEPEKGRPKKRQKKAPNTSASQLQAAAKRKSDADAAAAAAAAGAAGSSPPAADGPRGTLIVCPLSVLSNWQMQLEEHTAGNLKVAVNHGPERNRSRAWLAQQDVVITTYATLAGDVGLRGGGGLFGQQWLRVVLDEAHTIRNADTQQAKACRALKAQRRWAVTGTPLQNRIGDVFGLLAFLGLKPLDDKAFWRRCVERPLRQRDSRALLTLKVLMGSLALRRTKDSPGPDGQPLVALPPKTVTVVRLELGAEDALNYSRLESETKSLVAHHLSRGTLVENYTNVLTIIMRLRQVCDSSQLCPQALEALRAATAAAKAGAAGKAAPPPPELLAKLLAAVAGDDSEECAICLSPLELPCITSCGHVYCRRCIESVIVRDKPACPLCRKPIAADSLINPPPAAAAAADGSEAAADEQAPPSCSQGTAAAAAAGCSKIQALLAKLREVQQEEQQAAAAAAASGAAAPAFIKSVVFSQFTGMLDLIAGALSAEGIPFVRVDGKSSAKARKEAIQAFAGNAEGSPRVFLASLKAAGQGTNLTAGSHVHMMDPWWNPAVEDQAMDRVHRLGQTRAVQVWRYVALGTIEERMLELQLPAAQWLHAPSCLRAALPTRCKAAATSCFGTSSRDSSSAGDIHHDSSSRGRAAGSGRGRGRVPAGNCSQRGVIGSSDSEAAAAASSSRGSGEGSSRGRGRGGESVVRHSWQSSSSSSSSSSDSDAASSSSSSSSSRGDGVSSSRGRGRGSESWARHSWQDGSNSSSDSEAATSSSNSSSRNSSRGGGGAGSSRWMGRGREFGQQRSWQGGSNASSDAASRGGSSSSSTGSQAGSRGKGLSPKAITDAVTA